MAEWQHDGKCKNDYKSGAIVFTVGTARASASPKSELGEYYVVTIEDDQAAVVAALRQRRSDGTGKN